MPVVALTVHRHRMLAPDFLFPFPNCGFLCVAFCPQQALRGLSALAKAKHARSCRCEIECPRKAGWVIACDCDCDYDERDTAPSNARPTDQPPARPINELYGTLDRGAPRMAALLAWPRRKPKKIHPGLVNLRWRLVTPCCIGLCSFLHHYPGYMRKLFFSLPPPTTLIAIAAAAPRTMCLGFGHASARVQQRSNGTSGPN